MKISICLPVMGRGRMLARALYSILMQDHANLELVIKDGDPSSPVMDDPYVSKVIRCFTGDQVNYEVSKDAGIFPAANNCLKRAMGEILYFMCSDDLLCPGALQSVNQAFEADRFGGAMWAYGKTISADSLGRFQGLDGAPPNRELIQRQNCIGQPSAFWNRPMMELAGMFDIRYKHAADYDLWLRFWNLREPVFINRALGVFCHHDAQDTALHSVATDAESKKIIMRNQMFAYVTLRARAAQQLKQAYSGETMPDSHDNL